jgi:hypothetical protein
MISNVRKGRSVFSAQRTLQLLSDGVDKVEDEMAIIRVCDLAGIGAMLPLERAGGLLFKTDLKSAAGMCRRGISATVLRF